MMAFGRTFARWEVFLLVVLVAIFFIGGQASRYFLTTSNITVALEGVAPMALLGLTMTLIVITGEIDISVGSMVGLCASAMAVALEAKVPLGFAMLIGRRLQRTDGLLRDTAIACRHHRHAGALPRPCASDSRGAGH